ncbi:unnamed protein product [Ectocarpus sp. 8 AP-2014]
MEGTTATIGQPTTAEPEWKTQQEGTMGSAGRTPPPGAPAGGEWVEEKYCGCCESCVKLMCCCLFCYTPFDSRMVYVVGGKKYKAAAA